MVFDVLQAGVCRGRLGLSLSFTLVFTLGLQPWGGFGGSRIGGLGHDGTA
jgi:hypothetical protein